MGECIQRKVVRRLASTPLTIDISRKPDVLEIVQDVVTSGRPRILRKGDVDLVVVTPYASRQASHRHHLKTQAALERAAGSWPEAFADEVQDQIRESRKAPTKPPVEL